jgi:hypothetical protein
MELFNVLFKGVEVKITPFCKGFRTEDKAMEWIETLTKQYELEAKSSMGWNESKTLNDIRLEDKKGNSYYFVIYRQILE